MPFAEILKPDSEKKSETLHFKRMFNFRKMWKFTVLLTASVSLIPLIFIVLLDYNVTRKSVESEIILRTSEFTSNTWRSVSFFLNERKSALEFISRNNTQQALTNTKRLTAVLENLKSCFGGFSDIGIINASGYQTTYVGPYELEGKNYKGQAWFKEVMERGIYISDIFLVLNFASQPSVRGIKYSCKNTHNVFSQKAKKSGG